MPARPLLLASAVLLAAAPAAAERRFYVDHENGSDEADGRSPATPWKHAPGDARAPTAIRTLTLGPGDRLIFRGGARYRGTITVRAAGTPDNPAIVEGSGWGSVRAVIDGSEPLSGVRPCQSAADCLGAPHWAKLWRADLPAGGFWSDWLFVDDKPYRMAQWPRLAEADAVDPAKWMAVPLSGLAQLQSGRISAVLPAGLGDGQPVLGLWSQPNVLTFVSGAQVSTSGVTFDAAAAAPNSFRPYTNRDNRFTLMNVPAMIETPGQFALSHRDRVAVFWPLGAQPRHVSTGARRVGLSMARASHTVVRGFVFANFSGGPDGAMTGASIRAGNGEEGITIRDNIFRGQVTAAGGHAVIHTLGNRHLVIERNRILEAPFTRGIIVDNTRGPVAVRCNGIDRVGGTAIRFQNVIDGEIVGNRIADVMSVHGNGISAYSDNRSILIAHNIITRTARPMTVSGPSGTPFHAAISGRHGVLLRDNVLIGTSTINGALTSYGRLQGLRLERNFLAGGKLGLKMAGNEPDFSASGNILVGGVSVTNKAPLWDAASNTQHAIGGNGDLMVKRYNAVGDQMPAVC